MLHLVDAPSLTLLDFALPDLLVELRVLAAEILRCHSRTKYLVQVEGKIVAAQKLRSKSSRPPIQRSCDDF
jgi:hypothetical protein